MSRKARARSRREFLKESAEKIAQATLLSTPIPLFGSLFNGSAAEAQVTGTQRGAAGNAFVWGANTNGNLGRNDTTGLSSPVVLPGQWSMVSASELDPGTYGTPHINCAGIMPNNTLWVWGDNNFGQIGDGTVVAKSRPVQIAGSWASVSSSDERTHAIKTDGTLWSWGAGFGGALGNGSTANVSTPVQIAGSWTQVIGGGTSTSALKTDSTLWVWGYGLDGEMGDGTKVSKSTPVQLAGSWSQIAGGDIHKAAIKTDGTLWTWGYNGYGQLGTGTTTSTSSPVQVAGTWSKVSAGTMSTFGIRSDSTLWGWGSNIKGTLAQAGGGQFTSPVQIAGSWTQISSGGLNQNYGTNKDFGFAIGIKTDGTMWAWGYNANGQLGQSDLVDRSVPVQIPGSWTQVSCGSTWVIAIRKSAT